MSDTPEVLLVVSAAELAREYAAARASAPVVTREQVETLRRFTEGEPDFCDPDGEYLLRADVLGLFDARPHA